MKTTRQKLIDAGTSLFAKQGYDRTTVGEIEAAAGLKRRAGGFYRHFPSKESLLLAIADARFEASLHQGLTGILELGDTKTQLLLIAQTYRQIADESMEVSRIVSAQLQRLPKLKRKIRKINAEIFSTLRDWISTKSYAQSHDQDMQNDLLLSIIGGWLFYLTKKSQDEKFIEIDETRFMNSWAGFWAQTLDSPPDDYQ